MSAGERPRKVLLLTQYIHMGGLERMVFNLAVALKAQGGWEPLVFVYDRLSGATPENDLGPAFQSEGIPVISHPKEPGFSLWTVFLIRRTLADNAISVLHTHDLGPLIYGVCAKLLSFGRVRLIHTQHSFVHLSRRRIYKVYERFFTMFADEIAAVSPDTRRTYGELGIPPERVHVIPNGVRFRAQARSVGSKKEARMELHAGLDASRLAALTPLMAARWILYMARVHSTKGQERALALWASLSSATRARATLIFVGPESETGALERLRTGMRRSPDADRILYAGATDRPDLWLTASDLSLSCSEFEGMPLGPIEAAGAGLPLAVSAIPGHEVVKAWSSQFPLDDPASGARVVEGVLRELENGEDAWLERLWKDSEELRSLYTLSRMSEAYSRLYMAKAGSMR